MSILSLKDGNPVRSQAEQIPWPQKAPAACPISAVKARLRSVGLRPTRQRMALGWLLFAKGDRHVSAEMLYEEALRGEPAEVAQVLAGRGTVKGEITLVVAPPGDAAPPEPEAIDQALREAAATMPAGKAAALVAQRFGLAKRELYDRLLVIKDKKAQ